MNIAGIGSMELIVIMMVALVVLGPNKVVAMARNLGKAIGSFQKATSELPHIIEREVSQQTIYEEAKDETDSSSSEKAEREKEGPVLYRRGSSAPKEPDNTPPTAGGSQS